jgi:hypothetical protein
MCANTNFTCFGALPLELRLLVWEQALSVWTVWAAVHSSAARSRLTTNRLPFTMTFRGPEPFLVGLSCKEAWRLLERLNVRLVLGLTGRPNNFHSAWVDLKKTIIYLGDDINAIAVLNSFGAEGTSGFEHVALSWHQFDKLVRTCQRMAVLCPVLHTIIIQQGEKETITNNFFYTPLSPATANRLFMFGWDRREETAT